MHTESALFKLDIGSRTSLGADKSQLIQMLIWLNQQVTDTTQTYFQNKDDLPSYQDVATTLLIVVYLDDRCGLFMYVKLP